MIDIKGKKVLHTICIKISNAYNDIYVFKSGHIVSADIEKPFLITLSDSQIKLFKDLVGEFKILHIFDLKGFKKSLKDSISNDKEKDDKETSEKTDKSILIENTYTVELTSSENKKILDKLEEWVNNLNKVGSWENFILSDNESDNMKLILSLFKDNNYINFKPKDTDDSPEIILTKSLLPLVSEKNYTQLSYSSIKLDSNLFLIIFNFHFELFDLFMFHYYIPIKS